MKAISLNQLKVWAAVSSHDPGPLAKANGRLKILLLPATPLLLQP